MTIIEQLFSSKERVRLLRFALFRPDNDFTLKDLRKHFGGRFAERHPKELVRLGCFTMGVRRDTDEHTYRIDPGWLLFPEFRALFMKAQLLVEHDLVRRLQQTGRLRLLILTGLFVGERRGATDALVVGSVNRRRVARLFRQFERDLNQEVKYTIMSPVEYRYRKDIGDRFIYDILEEKHLVVIDTIERRSTSKLKTAKSPVKRKAKLTRRRSSASRP